MANSAPIWTSGSLVLTPVSADRLEEVEAVFDALQGYSQAVDGVPLRVGAAHEFATARPHRSAVFSYPDVSFQAII